MICDCNICQGAEVDPRTKESHMKKREISRVFTDRTPERPSEIGTSRSHISNDPIIPCTYFGRPFGSPIGKNS